MRFILLLATAFIFSCNNQTNTPVPREESQLRSVDSLELLYYKDPDGDSLRYTRFYTYLATKDSSLINGLINNLEDSSEVRNEIKPCRSEGKIFAHNGDQPVKTFYFSTRCDTCCYVYYIKDGEFYYYPLSAELRQSLKNLKPLAEELSPAGGSGREAAEGGSRAKCERTSFRIVHIRHFVGSFI